MSDPIELVKFVRGIAAEEARRIGQRFGDGTADVVEGSYAAIRKAGSTTATPGFFVPPHIELEVGDHVFWFDDGGYKKVLDVHNRNAVRASGVEARHSAAQALAAQPITADGYILAWLLPAATPDEIPPAHLLVDKVTLYTDAAAPGLDGSNFWTLELYAWEDGWTTPIATWILDDADDEPGQLRQATIETEFGYPTFYLWAAATGSPPDVYINGELTYREL